jgi:serine/threonine-protein phosphatase 2A regulatory subunit B
MEAKPVATFRVHEHLRAKLCDLYESDSIFDKFQCCLSADGAHVASGMGLHSSTFQLNLSHF